jgi:hypothetical protein
LFGLGVSKGVSPLASLLMLNLSNEANTCTTSAWLAPFQKILDLPILPKKLEFSLGIVGHRWASLGIVGHHWASLGIIGSR